MDPPSRLAHAFGFAEKRLNVQRLLDLEVLPHDTLATDEAVATPVSSPSPVTKEAPKIPQRGSKKTKKRAAKGPPQSPTEATDGGASLKEYQMCLEEVLTWLLEAEERLSVFEPISLDNVEIVKNQFKQHEEFMLSLTQSQAGVGDALHGGQLLLQSGQLNSSEMESVQKQMALVNEKWESLRRGAMERQAVLQEKLMTLQQSQLDNMRSWLEDMESEINKSASIAIDPDIVKEQTEKHKMFQEKIEKQQTMVNSLSSFVAVVDESQQAEENYQELENTLQDIGKRWMALCQWAEKRAGRLEGLEGSLRALGVEQKHFTDWLDLREAALGSLRSAHHLTNPKEVLEQVQNLQAMEQDLEAEHPRFVHVSQLSSEVAAKLEYDNPIGGADVRRKLEDIIQRWDNLVARMEEHSQMLIRSGKATSKQIKLPRKLKTETKIKESTATTKAGQTLVVKKTVTTVVRKHVAVHESQDIEPSGTVAESVEIETENKEATKKLKLDSGIEDFQEMATRFAMWLDKTEALLALTAENFSASDQLTTLQELRLEMDAHEDVLTSLREMGGKLTKSLEASAADKADLQNRVEKLNERWIDMTALADSVK